MHCAGADQLSNVRKLEMQVASLRAEVARLNAALNPPSDVVMRICEEVANEARVGVFDILGRSRLGHIAEARKDAMQKASAAGLSAAEIGRQMGRDHTTVLHALGKLSGRGGAQ